MMSFSEMRQQNVEHLGQVRTALLESDGILSLLYYEDEDVKWGLPYSLMLIVKQKFLKLILFIPV